MPEALGGVHRRRRKRLSLRGAAVWFAASHGAAILGYLALNAFASRLLGPETYGYFVIALTVSTVLGQLGLVGVHRAGLREAARLEADDVEGMRSLRRGVRAVSLVTLPVTSVITGVVTYFVTAEADTLTRWTVSVGLGLLVVLGGQQKLWGNYLRGFGQVRFASLLEGRSGGALVGVLQGVLVAAVLFLAPEWGLPGALAAAALGYALPVAFARRRVWRLWRHLDVRGSVFSDLRLVLARDWRFASNQVGSYLNSNAELWMAGLLLSRIDTSLFGAAQRLSMLLVIPLTSLQVVFAPVVARLIMRDDDRVLEPILRTGATLSAVITAAAWVPMLLIPGTLLTWVFGSEFSSAAPVLALLTVGYITSVAAGLCATALTMSHHEGVVATVQWVGVAARISLGVLAAKTLGLGLVGLGASAAAVTTALWITLWAVTRRRTGLRTHLTLRPNLRVIKETAG